MDCRFPSALRAILAPGLACALVSILSTPGAAFQVVSHTPAFYALTIDRDASITVTFDAPVNSATVSGSSVIVRGQMSGRHLSTLAVNGATLTIDPQLDFFTGEIVTVNLTKTLAQLGGGGATLTFGYSFQFTTRVLGGSLDLTELGNWSTAPADVPYFIYGGDLNGDRIPDVATPNEDSHDLAVFLNPGTGTFTSHTAYSVGNTPSSCFGDDFDLDGDQDIATANIASSDMTVLLNQGTGTFTGTTYASGTICRQVHGGDFDGDGDTDLVTTGNNDDTLNLFFNNGNGTFATPRVTINTTPDPFTVRVADMNADGRPDIVTAFQGVPRQVQVFVNQGNGVFAPGVASTVGNGAWDLYANDLSGDGKVDLLLVEAQSNRLRILLGDGLGGFSSSVTVVTGSFPLGVFAGDLDGDGDLDAITSNFSAADWRIFRNSGTGTFVLDTTLDSVSSGSYAWPHDLDGDGDLDLSAIDELNDRIYVFTNPGATGIEEPVGAPVVTRLAARPNPATAGAFIDYTTGLERDRITIRIVGADGRLVRTLGGAAATSGQGQLFWDGRAADGRPVPAGTYFLALDGAPGEDGKQARLTILR